MSIAYIRRQPNADQFELVFRYQNATLAIDRTFNFQRNVTETIETTLNRIRTNVEKEFNKKSGGKKKKAPKKGATTSQAAENQDGVANEIIVNLSVNGQIAAGTLTWLDLLTTADQTGFDNITLNVCEVSFTVTYNYPYVHQIVLPTVILVGFKCYPAKFEVHFTSRDECSFDWYRGLPTESKKDDDIAWVKCEGDSEFFYAVKESDIRHKLKVNFEFYSLLLAFIN